MDPDGGQSSGALHGVPDGGSPWDVCAQAPGHDVKSAGPSQPDPSSLSEKLQLQEVRDTLLT